MLRQAQHERFSHGPTDFFRVKGLPPREHLVDAGYVSAELLVCSQVHYGINLVGPARVNATWKTKVEGAYTGERFKIDWEQRLAHFPKTACQAC